MKSKLKEINAGMLLDRIKDRIPEKHFVHAEEALLNCSNHEIRMLQILRTKSPILAFILSLLLGLFGADRFYLRDNKAGAKKLVMLLLAIGFAVASHFLCVYVSGIIYTLEIEKFAIDITIDITAKMVQIVSIALMIIFAIVSLVLYIKDLLIIIDETKKRNLIDLSLSKVNVFAVPFKDRALSDREEKLLAKDVMKERNKSKKQKGNKTKQTEGGNADFIKTYWEIGKN